MIIDEKTRHNHDCVHCRERNLEFVAGKPVLLRRVFPRLRRRDSRTCLSLLSLDSRAGRWLKPRIPTPEEKACDRWDRKTRKGQIVQVQWTRSVARKPFIFPSGQDHADRTSSRAGFSSHCICRSSSAEELNAFEWRGTWYNSILNVRWFEDCYSLSFDVSEVRAANSAFYFDPEFDA